MNPARSTLATFTLGPDPTWDGFLGHIRQARQLLGNPPTVWYRGHSDQRWELVPSIFRMRNGIQKEREVFEEFERSAARLFEQRKDPWETLFDMQHYGIPTRLLDWSEVLGVAIAFLVYSQLNTGTDGAIYVLDPHHLNAQSRINDLKRVPGDSTFSYKKIYWEKEPFSPSLPIAIIPPLQSGRLFAQRGVFTIHGDDSRPLEETVPGGCVKVILPAALREAAFEFLQFANMDEYTIYPDIVGMARHINRKVFST